MRLFLLPVVLSCVCAAACGSQKPDTDTKVVSQKDSVPAATASASASSSNSATPATPATIASLPAPSEDLAKDTIPLRTPDGQPARYGIPSARITLQYSGAMKGTRMVQFDRYGLRMRKDDDMIPQNGTEDAGQHIIQLSVPEFYGMADRNKQVGWQTPSDAIERYLKSDSSKSIPYGRMLQISTGVKRLADTVIDGYHTVVMESIQPGARDILWMWRGIPIREHFMAKDGIDFWVNATEIATNVSLPDSTFQFPAGLAIKKREALKPGQMADPLLPPGRRMTPGQPAPLPSPGIPIPGQPK